MKSHKSVNVDGVCDHALVDRARARLGADIVVVVFVDVDGVDSLDARFDGEDLGEEVRSGGGN